MEQKVEPLSAEDADRIERQREWVRGHFTPEARHRYDSVEDKLRLLQAILDAAWIDRDETWKLQSLGITFGDALAQEMGLTWVAVEDDCGRDPALRQVGTTILLFPMTTISKRIERGETVDVRALFQQACDTVRRLRREGRYDLQ